MDVEKDILDQLSGDISASISLEGKFGVRVEPKDPAAFERTLAKIAGALPTLAEGLGLDDVRLVRPKGAEDLYALATPDGTSIVFGVKNGVFVITNDAGPRRRAWPSTSRPRPPAWRARSWSRRTPSRSRVEDARAASATTLRRPGPARGRRWLAPLACSPGSLQGRTRAA